MFQTKRGFWKLGYCTLSLNELKGKYLYSPKHIGKSVKRKRIPSEERPLHNEERPLLSAARPLQNASMKDQIWKCQGGAPAPHMMHARSPVPAAWADSIFKGSSARSWWGARPLLTAPELGQNVARVEERPLHERCTPAPLERPLQSSILLS